eukprot:7353890-Pyramimonas_sp.AAC.1
MITKIQNALHEKKTSRSGGAGNGRGRPAPAQRTNTRKAKERFFEKKGEKKAQAYEECWCGARCCDARRFGGDAQPALKHRHPRPPRDGSRVDSIPGYIYPRHIPVTSRRLVLLVLQIMAKKTKEQQTILKANLRTLEENGKRLG